MAQIRNVACKYYISEMDCEKGLEGTFRKACQTCKFYSTVQQPPRKKKRQNFDPDEVWRKKKEKNKEELLKRQMLEDLENEDG